MIQTTSTSVRTALLKAFGTAELDSIQPLSGGFSGAGVYKIRVGGIPYILRQEAEVDDFNDPRRWYPAMQIAADAALAPRIHYACAEDGVAIVDFIPQQSLNLDYRGDRSDLVVELAQTVRLLHETPPFPPLVDYLDGMEGLISRFEAVGVVAPEAMAPYLAAYRDLAAVYRRLPAEPVSSHNDINPRNLIYDGRRLWLVDWQASFLADRYVDLATVANFFLRTPAEEALMLRTYFGGDPGAARGARLFPARQINHMFHGLIFLVGVAAERPGLRLTKIEAPPFAELHRGLGAGTFDLDVPEGRQVYAQARLNAALENIRGPAMAEALAALDL